MIGLLSALDIVIIVLYFLVVIGVGLWSSCLNRGGTTDYFLAGRTMHWIPVGASLFASNIGSGHFLGLAGTGAANGIAVSFFESNATIALPLLGWLFLPVYLTSGVFTMPEYMRKRFGGQRIRLYLAIFSLILYVFTKISVDLYSGALFIEQAVPGIDSYASIFILLLIAAVVTILGGLTSVMWTDFVQTIIMLFGAFWLMIACFLKIGGLGNLTDYYFSSISNTTLFSILTKEASGSRLDNVSYNVPTSYAMHLFRPIDDPELPWLGLLGSLFSAIWYWCTDQVIVQRSLAAKNLSHAKAGCVLASYLKLLPIFLMVFPGMISRVLFPDEVGCSSPETCMAVCGKQSACTDAAFPKLVLNMMPTGARGLMMAVMLSSLVSSLTSIFNSASTIFTIDIWRRLRKNAGDAEFMIVGRVFVVLLVAVSIAWLPVVRSSSQIFAYIQGVQSFLGPPIAAVFILAVFWPRANEKGSFWALIIGLTAGLIRFIVEYSYPSDGPKPPVISRVNYLHFGILLFFLTIISCVVISMLTDPISSEHLHRLLYVYRFSLKERVDLDKETATNIRTRADENGDVEVADNVGSALFKKIGSGKFGLVVTKSLKWVCGIEELTQSNSSGNSMQNQTSIDELVQAITENRRVKFIVNANLIAMLTFSVFIVGYFG